MTTPTVPLEKLLHASNVLAGQTKPSVELAKKQHSSKPELADVLVQRLASITNDVIEALSYGGLRPSDWQDLDENGLKRCTGSYALALLQELQKHELQHTEKRASSHTAAGTSKAAQQPAPPLFGIRDIKTIQILASLVARWNLAFLLDQGILPSEMQERVPSLQVIEQEEDTRAALLQRAAEVCSDMLLWTPSTGMKGEIQSAILPHLLLPTLAALLQLDHTGTKASAAADDVLDSINPSTSMAALFTLLSSKTAGRGDIKPAWVNPAVSSLLSKQIERPGGILGLLNVMLGRADQELHFAQLEQIAKLIVTPPKGVPLQVHISHILPKILGILRPPTSGNAPPPSFVRALCFCLSTLISTAPEYLQKHLQSTLSLQGTDIEAQIDLLSVIIGNIDPSHTVYSFLLEPLIVKLFSMYFHISETRGDPVLKGAIENIISVWARAMSADEIVQGITRVVDQSPGYQWQRSDTGGVQSVRHGDDGAEEAPDAIIRPNPDLVVHWLKNYDRPQVTTALLVHWLGQVNLLRQEPDQEGNLRLQKMIILRLQLILKIIEECGSDIVKEAQQTLQFIDLALDDSTGNDRERTRTRNIPLREEKSKMSSLSLADLKIVDDESSDTDEGDDELEFPELLGIAPSEQLQVTSLTLLLAVLEGNEDLMTENTPTLRSIDSKLERLVGADTDVTARLAKDARFVLSLRSASARSSATGSTQADDTLRMSRDLYQEALKLLQDPILPVRAQGLSMLRSLVESKDALLTTDTALIPAILDIFVHAVQDVDSFIYLSAVQGLSGMVDHFGKDISRRLTALYTGNDPSYVGEGDKGVKELDNRLRVGEAIIQVIQRAEAALPIYIDIIVPPVLQTIRSPTLPVALRTSAVSILSACADASSLALLSYRHSMVDGMLDLLSLESRQAAKVKVEAKPKDETPDALEVAATHPSLRRGALMLLSRLLRSTPESFAPAEFARMTAVLGYVKQVDEDPLVRHNASEVLEDCIELTSAPSVYI